jgi:hypothetical protein
MEYLRLAGHGMGGALVAAAPRTNLDKPVDQIEAELSTE